MNYDNTARCIHKMLTAFNLSDPDEFEFVLNSIRDSIFKHLKPIHSGLISKRAAEAYNNGVPKSKLCEEHYYPRTTIAKLIMNKYQERMLTHDGLVDILKMGAQVHLVLSEENNALAKYQRDGSMLWKENHYDPCGIELVEFVERPRGIPFNIYVNGKYYDTYETREEAQKAGFSSKLLNSLTSDTTFTAKKTHPKSSHIFKAGDIIRHERLQ